MMQNCSCSEGIRRGLQSYRVVVALVLISSAAAVIIISLLSPRHQSIVPHPLRSAKSSRGKSHSPAVARSYRSTLARSRPPAWRNGSSTLDVAPTGLLVDTRSCQIPDFDAYNPSISPYINDPDPQFIVCNHSLPITFTDGQYIRLNTTLTTSLHIKHCLYQQVRSLPW